METYFILMIVVMLVGVTIQKETRPETYFTGRQEEREMAAPTACENIVNYADILGKFKILSEVGNEQKAYEIIVNENRNQKSIKNWRMRLNKTHCSANPRMLFNILRSLPMGEPYFIQ